MTNDVEQKDGKPDQEPDNSNTALVPKDRPSVETRAVGAPLRPENIDGMWRMSVAVAKAPILPESYRGRWAGRGHDRRFVNYGPDEVAGNVFLAIQHGAEVGLAPMQAIQSIAVINNRPALWGDAVIGIVRASGKCAYIKEWVEGEGAEMVAHCESQRLPGKEVVRRSFTWLEAQAAGLVSKDTYQNYPRRMIQMRARGYCLRDLYPDLLKGLHSAEELQQVLDAQQRADGVYDPEIPKPERPQRADFDHEAAAKAQEERDQEAMDAAYAGTTDQPMPDTEPEDEPEPETGEETNDGGGSKTVTETSAEAETEPETEPQMHPYEATMRARFREIDKMAMLDDEWEYEEKSGNWEGVPKDVLRTLDNVYQIRRVELGGKRKATGNKRKASNA